MYKKLITAFVCFCIATSSTHGITFPGRGTTFQGFLKKISNALTGIFTSKEDKFYATEEGKLYRSKQLTGQRCEHYITKYGIKTIVNLRKPDPEEKWYQDEIAAAQKHNVRHINLTLRVDALPTKEQVTTLLDIFKLAPRPILIHCRGGSDRTGLVSALWILEMKGGTLKEALDQQTTKYGHYRLFHPSMRQFTTIWHELMQKYPNLEKRLQQYDPAHYSQRFDSIWLVPAADPTH